MLVLVFKKKDLSECEILRKFKCCLCILMNCSGYVNWVRLNFKYKYRFY